MVPSLAFVTLLPSVSFTDFPVSFNVSFQSVFASVPISVLPLVRAEDLPAKLVLLVFADEKMTDDSFVFYSSMGK